MCFSSLTPSADTIVHTIVQLYLLSIKFTGLFVFFVFLFFVLFCFVFCFFFKFSVNFHLRDLSEISRGRSGGGEFSVMPGAHPGACNFHTASVKRRFHK